jgi:hypothetical protein
VGASGDAGFDFGNGVIDYLDRPAAVAAFVVLGALQRGFGFAQMGECSAHVGLISPNGLKTHRADHSDKNKTRFEHFHGATF